MEIKQKEGKREWQSVWTGYNLCSALPFFISCRCWCNTDPGKVQATVTCLDWERRDHNRLLQGTEKQRDEWRGRGMNSSEQGFPPMSLVISVFGSVLVQSLFIIHLTAFNKCNMQQHPRAKKMAVYDFLTVNMRPFFGFYHSIFCSKINCFYLLVLMCISQMIGCLKWLWFSLLCFQTRRVIKLPMPHAFGGVSHPAFIGLLSVIHQQHVKNCSIWPFSDETVFSIWWCSILALFLRHSRMFWIWIFFLCEFHFSFVLSNGNVNKYFYDTLSDLLDVYLPQHWK